MVRRLVLAASVALLAATPAQAVDVAYRATLSPREALFGDPVEARIDVAVDPKQIDPDTVRVHTDFRPYAATPARIERRVGGGLVRLSFVYRLTCLDKKCLPKGPERTIVFAPLRVRWENTTQILRWPSLQLASRLDPRDVAQPTPRSDVVRQPPMTWGVRPSTAIWVLVAAAVLLLAYPALLAFRAGRRAWLRWRTSRLERLSPLERALELLKRAAAGGEPDSSRRALERVARELGEDELGTDARRLAWSRSRPEPETMESLRARVEDGQ
jgi:hypothetical protein